VDVARQDRPFVVTCGLGGNRQRCQEVHPMRQDCDPVDGLVWLVVETFYGMDRAGYEAESRRHGMALERYAAAAVTELVRQHEEAPLQRAEDWLRPDEPAAPATAPLVGRLS
jgi:hypothetical protein